MPSGPPGLPAYHTNSIAHIYLGLLSLREPIITVNYYRDQLLYQSCQQQPSSSHSMSSQAESAPPGAIDLTTLPVPQLRALQQRLDAELEHLTQSHTKLRAAQTKFKGCIQSIADGVEENKSQATQSDHILIPLTNSLYVKGKIESREKVIVDVGTGFYVEKTTAKAKEFYEKKVKELDTNIHELDKVLQVKTMNERVVQDVLRQKILKDGPQGSQ